VGYILKFGYNPSYHLFQAYLSSQVFLKRLEHQNVNFVWIKQIWIVRFLKPEHQIYVVLTLPGVKLTPSLSILTLFKEHMVESSQDPPGGNFLIPPWNSLILWWIQLPKDR
jgi:hypothetical protein